ncbi:hypothetical protein Pfeifenkraut_BL30061 [Xanthomonas phage Pfeifenkraut]|uniref:Uncharacterized protein n=1 Tax=Xanthomonas phage Pfeifenkraut TaxID=2939132 RepID=A0A9E7J5M5_9CAUD|nr:hypothetical protein QAY91_gp61 [Xanthomonas phage Pfeifenkraut]URA06958.1 hypothetical protein Pfeifenkraut_BL30061 [Xanthomonas phage Pfeifenkraut]
MLGRYITTVKYYYTYYIYYTFNDFNGLAILQTLIRSECIC